MMLERGNVLILDEPTNHLDMSSKEVLEEALLEYDGTIIFVSHDRYLLNKIASRIIEVTEDGCTSYKGNFDYYLEVTTNSQLEEQKLIAEKKQEETKAEQKQKQYRTKEQRSADAARKNRIRQLENEIEQLETDIFNLEEEIASPEVAKNYDILNEKCILLEEYKNKLGEMLDEWASLED